MEAWAQGLAELFSVWSLVQIGYMAACGFGTVRLISATWGDE